MKTFQALLLCAWVSLTPWFTLPGLPREVSHRLSLLMCFIGIGLSVCFKGRLIPNPIKTVFAVSLAVMGYHLLPILSEGAYFEYFIETAFLSNGLIILIAGIWSFWGLRQLPLNWLRMSRWAGLVLLIASIAVCLTQGNNYGIFYIDRLLAAFALMWLPVIGAWNLWILPIPIAVLILSGKQVAWAAALIGLASLMPRRFWKLIPIVILAVIINLEWQVISGKQPMDYSRIAQRVQTWVPTLRASLDKPIFGWGFSPMVYSRVQERYGARLPSPHSDWVSVILHGGLPLFGSIAYCFWWLIRLPVSSRWQLGLRSSIIGILSLSAVQPILSTPRIAGTFIVLIAWYLSENGRVNEA